MAARVRGDDLGAVGVGQLFVCLARKSGRSNRRGLCRPLAFFADLATRLPAPWAAIAGLRRL